MPLHLVPLVLTIVAVLVLGIVAVIGSTSGGADWLQRLWKRDSSGADTLAGSANPLGDTVERRDGGDGAQLGRLAGHPVDDT